MHLLQKSDIQYVDSTLAATTKIKYSIDEQTKVRKSLKEAKNAYLEYKYKQRSDNAAKQGQRTTPHTRKICTVDF